MNNHFGKILKELRLEHGLSQFQLAQNIDYSKTVIRDWETGRRNPTINALIAIALFFDVSIDYLAGLEDELGNKIVPKKL